MTTHSQTQNPETPVHLRRSARGRGADDAVEELNFEDVNPPRTGDPVHSAELAEQLPHKREHDAGLTGGELPEPEKQSADITDDDLSPETLYDEQEQYELYPAPPTDKQLRVAGSSEIGGGFGKDEAELARDEHPGR